MRYSLTEGRRMTTDYMVLMAMGYKYPTMVLTVRKRLCEDDQAELVPQYRL